LVIVSIIGISKLTVENRFIDYFKPTTEIYQGMELIDKQLGGTTPLDVIIDADPDFFTPKSVKKTTPKMIHLRMIFLRMRKQMSVFPAVVTGTTVIRLTP
jgi:predicted RND superfamily exporter protein